MELRACCFLMFAALAWAPSSAREVGIYLQAMQGGHVDPKTGNKYWMTTWYGSSGTTATGYTGSPETEATGSPGTEATGSPETEASGNPGTEATGSPGTEATGGPTAECSANTGQSSVPASTTATCKCGVANPSRIVGGEEVDPKNKYPWHVGIKNNGGTNYWCGGSVINNKYILTAAHCVEDEEASSLVVGVADHDMSSSTDDVQGVTDLKSVEQIIIHSCYGSNGNDYDIALLKLKETLDLSQYDQLRPVCLPADDSQTYEGVMAIASGWGRLYSDGPQPSQLNEVSVPVLAPSCPGMSGITANMLCAGLDEGGKDTCQGDSGGPLFVADSARYTQVGITSWGIGCADKNSPGVYARVSKFLPWIMSNTADATYCQ